MPDLIKLYLRSVMIGFALSAAFVALLLWFNIGNLGHLVMHTAGGPFALILLVIFNGLVFSAAQTAVAVLLMAESDNDAGPGGNAGIRVTVPVHTDRH